MSMSPLDPRTWPEAEVEKWLQDSAPMRSLEPAHATHPSALVAGSTGPFAQYAGRKALEAGGSAADAALVTAFTQVALAHGGWVSYAGIMSAVTFDATTGEITSLSGHFATFASEDDPATIPGAPTPSGRTALVPGYFKAAEELHRRFGRLPWADLLLPAIHVASHGFVLGAERAGIFTWRKDVLLRTPEGREIFQPDGNFPTAETRFTQPVLASTLRRVAEEGADHLYAGEWAQRFVEVVAREGGRVTLDDLADYKAIWSEPITATIGEHVLHGPGLPNTGGAALAEGLLLAEAADIGDWRHDGDELHLLISIMRTVAQMTGLAPQQRTTPEHVTKVLAAIRESGGPVSPGIYLPTSHSDFVLSADPDGNVVAMCHSINTSMWGSSGIFVDGISIPDAAGFQQQVLATVTPGDPLPNPMNPSLVTRDGTPVLAMSSIGAGLMETTLQCMISVLREGATVAQAVSQPLIHHIDMVAGDSITSAITTREDTDDGQPRRGAADPAKAIQEFMLAESAKGTPPEELYGRFIATVPQVVEEGFDQAVLDRVRELGIKVVARPIDEPTMPRGYWVGMSIDPVSGARTGARTIYCTGLVEGF